MRRSLPIVLLVATAAVAGDELTPPESRRFQAHSGRVGTVEVSSGSRFLLTTCYSQKQSVKVFDLTTRECRLETSGSRARFSPDGRRLAVGGEHGVTVFDLGDGHKLGPIGQQRPEGVCVSRGGELLAATHHEKVLDKSKPGNEKGWRVEVLEIATGVKKRTIDLDDGPAGVVGFVKGDREVICWQWVRRSPAEFETIHTAVDVATGARRILEAPRKAGLIPPALLVPDGERLVWAFESALVMTEVATQKILWKTEGTGRTPLALDAAGEKILASGALYDAKTGERKERVTYPEAVHQATLAGEWVLFGSEDGSVVFVKPR